MRAFAIISLLCAGVLLIMGIGMVYAAGENTHTQTSTVTLDIPHAAKLDITNADPSKTLVQDGSAETAFDAGYVELDAAYPTLVIRANKNWKLSAKSGGFAVNGAYTKDIGDLQLKDAGAAHVTMSSYVSLSAVDQEVASSAAGVRDESHPCQYKILLDYTKDIPGTYTAIVTYTLATQS